MRPKMDIVDKLRTPYSGHWDAGRTIEKTKQEAADEIELLRHFAVVLLDDDANQAMAMILDNENLGELAKLAKTVDT